jgi:two-component system, OmpR family, alkaline phosphatase synthesis response regulator PhoP
MKEKLLLIEDERDMLMALTDRLQSEGYIVESCRDGREGLERATRDPFDLIILDIMLPSQNGFDVCRGIRQEGMVMPILILTAKGQTIDKIVGLKIGADDYLTKPFDMYELMARVEALLRRAPSRPPGPGGAYHLGSLRVDLRRVEVLRQNRRVNLSCREFQLLSYFVEHPGAALSRGELLKEVWGFSADVFTRTVDVHVAALRQKLENDPKKPELFLTVPGLGYKLSDAFLQQRFVADVGDRESLENRKQIRLKRR